MKKNKLRMMAAIAAGLMLAGCDLPDEPIGELLAVSTETAVATVDATPTDEPVKPAQPTEPDTTLPAVSHINTPQVEQPVGFESGDTAWIVLHYDDQAGASTHSAVVIAEITGYLITAPQYCGDGADRELMWDLVLRSDDGRQCLDIWPIGDCYASRDDAQAAVEREMAG